MVYTVKAFGRDYSMKSNLTIPAQSTELSAMIA